MDITQEFYDGMAPQYDKLFNSLVDGSLVVDNSFDTAVTPSVSSITVDYQE